MPISQFQFSEMQARLIKNKPVPKIIGECEINEATLHDRIISDCKARRWIYFHGSMAHKAMRTLGEPDFTVLADKGRVFFLEIKSRSGKLSAEQLALKCWAEMLGHPIHTIKTYAEYLGIVKG